MEKEIQQSLLKTWEKTLKSLILTIFKLVFKLKQWPDFGDDDKVLMKDFNESVDILQTTLNLMSWVDKLNYIDWQKALEDQNKNLELLKEPDEESLQLWSNSLINCSLEELVSNLLDEETIDLIKKFSSIHEEVNERKEIIKGYGVKIEESIQDIKTLYRTKMN